MVGHTLPEVKQEILYLHEWQWSVCINIMLCCMHSVIGECITYYGFLTCYYNYNKRAREIERLKMGLWTMKTNIGILEPIIILNPPHQK